MGAEPKARTPRIPLLSTEDAKALGKQAGVPSSMAHLNVFRTLLHHPKVAGAASGLLASLLWKANVLDERLRELIIMRIGWRSGAVYEWTQHWHVATGIGMNTDEILAVRDWRQAEGLDNAAKAVLAATDETLDDGRISDATWDVCCQHLKTNAERIELVLAISNWRTFSELLLSLNIPLEDGIQAWPPDGRTPAKALART